VQLKHNPYQNFDIQLSEIFNDFTDALCLIDDKGIVHLSNKAYINLFGDNPFPPKNFISNFSEDHQKEIIGLIQPLFSKNNKEHRFENEFILKDRRKLPELFRTQFLPCK